MPVKNLVSSFSSIPPICIIGFDVGDNWKGIRLGIEELVSVDWHKMIFKRNKKKVNLKILFMVLN